VNGDTSSISDNFHETSHAIKKQRRLENKRRRVIQGSRTAGSVRGAPEPCRDAFIYRVDPDTTTEMMRQYISDNEINIKSLECVSNPNAKFKSFKLTTTVSKFKELFNADLWPEGIMIRKYIPPRRGDNY